MERREEAFPKISNYLERVLNLADRLGLKITLTPQGIKLKCGKEEVLIRRYGDKGWIATKPNMWNGQVRARQSERAEQTQAVDHPESEEVR